MTIFFYIAAFLLFAVLQSIFINGLYIAMEGKEKLDKNGNLKADGDILYFIKRELSKGTKTKELMSGISMIKAIRYVEIKYEKKFTDDIVYFDKTPAIEYNPLLNQDKLTGFLQTLQLNEGIKYGPLEDWLMPEEKKDGMRYYVLWTNETKFKYPSFFRLSVGGGCIKCMSSFYSLITFVPLFIYLFGIRWEVVPLLIFDAVILVFLNYYFFKAT